MAYTVLQLWIKSDVKSDASVGPISTLASTTNPSLPLFLTNRRLHRQHPAECAGRAALLQAALGQCCAWGAGQRLDPAVLPHSLHAAAPPSPPFSAASAVRQPAGGAR